MNKVTVYSSKGVKKQPINLPNEFSEKENAAILSQAIRVYADKTHLGSSKTKTRGEVSISTRKIYRQKGTGNARHGAKSAPIFVGGGTAHGPVGFKKELAMPKKMRKKAFSVSIAKKLREGKLVAVDGIMSLKKTKDAQNLINAVLGKEGKEKVNRITFALAKKNMNVSLAVRNIEGVQALAFEDLNAFLVYYGGFLFIDKEALVTGPQRKSKGAKK